MKYLIKHYGFNRQQRRHSKEYVVMITEQEKKYGRIIPKNTPYVNKDK